MSECTVYATVNYGRLYVSHSDAKLKVRVEFPQEKKTFSDYLDAVTGVSSSAQET